MTGLPPITVVIPVAGSGDGLQRAITSVRRQSHSPDAVVVVDDGLTDVSVRHALTDASVKVLDGPRTGAGGARNVGLRAAETDWVALLDADDLWGPRHLELAAQQIAVHPESGACFAGALHVSDDGRELARFTPAARYATLPGLLRRQLQPTVSATVVNRNVVFAVGGFFEGFRRGAEDADLWWRVANGHRCLAQPEPHAFYIVHQERDRSRTKSELSDLSADFGLCIDRLEGTVPPALTQHAAAQYRALMARYWYLAGFGSEGRAEARRSLRWRPTLAGTAALALGLLPPPLRRASREGLRRLRRPRS